MDSASRPEPPLYQRFWLHGLNALPVLVSYIDRELRYRFANHTYERWFGISSETIFGKGLAEVLGETAAAEVRPRMLRALAGETVIYEDWLAYRGGSRYVRATYSPDRDASGFVAGIFVLVEDLTEREHARQRIVELNDELQRRIGDLETLLHVIPMGVGIATVPDCSDIRINPEFARMLGVSPDLNASLTAPDGPHDAFRVERAGRPLEAAELPMQVAARENREVRDFELTVVRADGQRLEELCHAAPLRDPEGRVRGCVAAFLDITSRKNMEEELRRSEERFRSIFNLAAIGMAQCSVPDGRFTAVNRRYSEIVGYGEAELKNMTFLDVTHPDDRAGNETMFRSLLDGDIPEFVYEKRYIRKSGEILWVRSVVTVVRSESGAPMHTISAIEDITARRQAEEALRQAQKIESVGLLAAGIAHDFNNLLTGIMGGAGLLLECLPPDHESRATAELILGASERAAHLTRQLLAYAGKGKHFVETLELSELVAQTCALVMSSLPSGVSLALEPSGGVTIEADAGQIEQVVMNLVINAGEAIGEGRPGRISVRTRIEELPRARPDFFGNPVGPGRFAVLEVMDDGDGIDPASLRSIFDPFFTTKFTGRGLGLAAVQGIVRTYRGGIEVETQLNRGTAFRVYFPAAAAPSAPHPSPEPEIHVRKALLVDDEPSVRQICRAYLLRLGLEAEVVENGREALEALDRVDPCVILLDLKIPGMAGPEILTAIRARRPGVPVIAMSGYAEKQVADAFAGHRISAFLQKPFTLAALRAALASAGTSATGGAVADGESALANPSA